MRSPLAALALVASLARTPKPTELPRATRYPVPTREQRREDMKR